MPHQSVEIERRRRSRVRLVIVHLRLLPRRAAISRATCAVSSSVVPFGHVHDHLELALVVERQHLDLDQPVQTSDHGEPAAAPRHRRETSSARRAVQTAAHEPPVEPGEEVLPSPCSRALSTGLRIRTAAHGVTMKATSSENSIAALAPIGIGRMYGPISPPTNAIGRIAATTANVARMVGLPTSLTASTATRTAWRPRFAGIRQWRTMFSTTTMASSTRMPIEKISAKSVIRLSV